MAGYVSCYGGAALSWAAKSLKIVPLSSAEAESAVCISKDREDLVAAAVETLDTGSLSSTDAPMHGACALSCLCYLSATSCLAAGVCRETSGETHLISTEVQQDLPRSAAV
jgi:hypothetical protein